MSRHTHFSDTDKTETLSDTEDEPPSLQLPQKDVVALSPPKIGLLTHLKNSLFPRRNHDSTLRETIEEYIEEPGAEEEGSVSAHERALLSNILHLGQMPVADVMVPRADIVAIDIDITKEELFGLLAERQFSRIPVYKDTLDDVLGTIHIKDILAAMAKNETISIPELITDVPIVSPAMPVTDLILTMRQNRRHMALVVDEFGGIDGLVTIGDVIESIVGEIDDEHDTDEDPQMHETRDGTVLADARVDVESFEERYGSVLSEEEREECYTLGGLVFSMAGRVPARGEILTHKSGIVFEVLDADPRRIHRLRIRNLPRDV
ncbi:MAG: HlyC/CorC family transporter [Alphaproteobacteria bacterium]|nr:HlyC/CorC family transporter [Alphaproteobacteria bacterium]